MAEVTGYLGNDQITLDNAATEATLRALLTSNEASQGILKAVANKLGIENDTINAILREAAESSTGLSNSSSSASESLGKLLTPSEALARSFYNFDSKISPLIGKLAQGTASVTDVTGAFIKLHPVLGIAIDLFNRVVTFQEAGMEAYQQTTNAGVSFSGSLTDLREAAARSYLTLDQFSGLISKNSDAFSRMGNNANDGAVNFANASNALLKGPVGTNLLALGYRTDQVNQGLVNYIALSGGRTASEMKNTEKLTAGAAAYLTELDDLAQITGKTREQQEQELKQLQANQAFQAYMQTLDETGRAKASAALLEANAKGGKGAAEALQAQLMGLPPMTKAAQEFTAVAPRMAEANNKMAAAVQDSRVGIEGVKRAGDELGAAAVQTKKDYDSVGSAIIMSGGSLSGTMGAIFGTANRLSAQGVANADEASAQRKRIETQRAEREQSQAADMAAASKAMKEAGSAILGMIDPIVSGLTPAIKNLAKGVRDVSEFLNKILTSEVGKSALIGGAAVGGIGLISSLVSSIKSAGGIKSIPGILKGKAGAAFSSVASIFEKMDGSTEAKALWVRVAGGGGLGDVLDQIGGKGKAANGLAEAEAGIEKAASKAFSKKMLRGLKGGVVGIAGGIALDYASDYAKEHGAPKAGAGLSVASDALSGAGTGAMIGSIVPGIGTAVGAAVGGALGGAYGLYKNYDTLFKKEDIESDDEQNKESKEKKEKDAREKETLELLRKQTELLMQSSGHLEQQTVHLQGVVNNTNNFGPSWVK